MTEPAVPYRVVMQPRVHRQIARWPMPDVVLVDCHQQLSSLRNNPAEQLVREKQPFDGMTMRFEVIDPINRLVVHRFGFLIVYGMDEETLFVDAASHERSTVGE
jgi:hypothetical protein